MACGDYSMATKQMRFLPMKLSSPLLDQFSIILTVTLLAFGAMMPAKAVEYVTTFESDLGDWTAIKDTSLFNWSRQSNSTPSGYTGPDSAHEGDYYLYLEASRNSPSKTAYLESRHFSGETVTKVTFFYHMYGAHMGTLALEVFDGNNWHTA